MSILIEADEQSTLTLVTKITTALGVAVTPTAAAWTLTNKDGDIINSRTSVPMTPLSEAMTVNVAGDDLQIEDQANKREYRLFTVVSDRGDVNLPQTIQTPFWVKNLKAITT
jgi:hypothetical protein